MKECGLNVQQQCVSNTVPQNEIDPSTWSQAGLKFTGLPRGQHGGADKSIYF